MILNVHPSWHTALALEFEQPYWLGLTSFLRDEYARARCFPEEKYIFRAFDMTPFDGVKVVILGQDPYHTPGAAMGLSFSIPDGISPQPSLKNIFKELESDIGIIRTSSDLSDWATQGVLLLNSVLTVREGEPASHRGRGWEDFTDKVISTISEKKNGVVFILWGAYAISKGSLIDGTKHRIITSPHPSPLSAYRGFFGSRPFSQTDEYLRNHGEMEIFWI